MAVKRLASLNLGGVSLSAHPIHYLCDTTGELPSTGLKVGDTALAIDTNVQYKALNSTQWTPIATAAGAVPFSKTAVFSDVAAVAPLTVVVWTAPFACTVTAIKGYRVGGTGATINAYRGTTATALRSANLSLASADTWIDGGAVQNTAFAINDSLLLRVVTVVGAPTQISVQVNFTRP